MLRLTETTMKCLANRLRRPSPRQALRRGEPSVLTWPTASP